MIMRSPHSLALLRAVFAPLGQHLPVELGARKRLVQTALSAPYFVRYPLYITCANLSALAGSNYPLFLLSESGAMLHEPLPAPAARQIAGVSQYLISSLIVPLIDRELTGNEGGSLALAVIEHLQELAVEFSRNTGNAQVINDNQRCSGQLLRSEEHTSELQSPMY